MARSSTQSADGPCVRLHTPAQLAAAVPYLVGFTPVESLVLVGLAGEPPHVVVTMRIDLPAPRDCGRAGKALVGYLSSASAETALVILATEGEGRRPRQDVLEAVDAAATEAGVVVSEALLLRDGHWRSLYCEDRSCCPAEGTPIDTAEVGELAAAAAYTGRVVHPSRDHLVDTLAPLSLDSSQIALFDRIYGQLVRERVRGGRRRIAAQTRRLLTAAVLRRAELCPPLPIPELVRLAGGLTDVAVRDWALHWLDGELEHSAESLWVELTRRARGSLVAPPATLLAVHAYLRGDGAYARTALDRAQDADPRYSFADLLSQSLDRGLSPDILRAAIRASAALP